MNKLAQAEATLWQYLNSYQLQPLAPCRWLLVMGCADTRVAEYSAQLYHQGRAQHLLFSGGRGRVTKTQFAQSNDTEASVFADIAHAQGVPKEHLYCEPTATNTAENVTRSFEFFRTGPVAEFSGSEPLLVVCRNIYRPRVAATLQRWQPEQAFLLASPPLTYAQFVSAQQTLPGVRHSMVGEINRLVHYPQRGWLPPVAIPEGVMQAYQVLLQAGFSEQLVG
ncbi:YdcF family protein [Halioxenophilus aromaticivorans]|uniref:YdcF family protein n=1 Tax=Halioxenophilus aromaticivorans TaxID=1306992 RepID=UPI0031E9925D